VNEIEKKTARLLSPLNLCSHRRVDRWGVAEDPHDLASWVNEIEKKTARLLSPLNLCSHRREVGGELQTTRR